VEETTQMVFQTRSDREMNVQAAGSVIDTPVQTRWRFVPSLDDLEKIAFQRESSVPPAKCRNTGEASQELIPHRVSRTCGMTPRSLAVPLADSLAKIDLIRASHACRIASRFINAAHESSSLIA